MHPDLSVKMVLWRVFLHLSNGYTQEVSTPPPPPHTPGSPAPPVVPAADEHTARLNVIKHNLIDAVKTQEHTNTALLYL